MATVAVFAFSTLICQGDSTASRRIPEGALLPEFSAVDMTGKSFTCARSSGKTFMLAFLSSQSKHSQEAVADILEVLSSVPSEKLASLHVGLILQDVDDKEFVTSIQKEAPPVVQILDDDRYDIWGKFGIIATPSLLIADPQGKVICVKSGQAYDFAPTIKFRLFQALDIPQNGSAEDASKARTVANSTVSAKARRHLQMAKSLARKGKVISAIEQAQIAYEIDPNLPEVALELGELLCRAGEAKKAITLINDVSVESRQDKARMNLALGWANRQLGKLDEAEKFLLEGIRQDPMLHRLFFELGRVHQARGDAENAMQAYFQALKLIYGDDQR